jgi:hypothetical protein
MNLNLTKVNSCGGGNPRTISIFMKLSVLPSFVFIERLVTRNILIHIKALVIEARYALVIVWAALLNIVH